MTLAFRVYRNTTQGCLKFRWQEILLLEGKVILLRAKSLERFLLPQISSKGGISLRPFNQEFELSLNFQHIFLVITLSSLS